MAGRTAEPLRISRELACEVEQLTRRPSLPQRTVQRAWIVCLAYEGLANAEIARQLGVCVTTVVKWRRRMEEQQSLAALDDVHRSGRPAEVPLEVRCTVIKLACDRPKDVPFRDVWTLASLAEATAQETGWLLSKSEVHRILHCNGISPHHVRMWLHSPDAEFQEKVKPICELYLAPPPGATVWCVDEKPGMQALERKHPTKHSAQGVRREFEYKRHGTSTLIGAFNISTGEVRGHLRRRTAANLVSFMETLAKKSPTGDVYIVWDNLNIHHEGKDSRWIKFNERHGGRFHFLHTPKHASWVNQIEIWFSILQRRVLKYGSFSSCRELNAAVRGFIRYWNRRRHPFNWRFRGTFEPLAAQAA